MWFARTYDPVQAGSIDGTDSIPHDRAIVRATRAAYRPPGKTRAGVTKDPLCTLFVGRLSPETTDETLYRAFSVYGEVRQAAVTVNFVTGVSRCYGFVEFASERVCRDVYRQAHRLTIDERAVLVDYERARVMNGWVPRRQGGGFGGKKESGQLRFGARNRPFKRPIVHLDPPVTNEDESSMVAYEAELRRLRAIEHAAERQRTDDCWRDPWVARAYHRNQRERGQSSTDAKQQVQPPQPRSTSHSRHRRQSVSRERRRHRSRSASDRRREYDHGRDRSRRSRSRERHRSRRDEELRDTRHTRRRSLSRSRDDRRSYRTHRHDRHERGRDRERDRSHTRYSSRSRSGSRRQPH
ncbi:hypothetical protein THASP1DRAFT_28015 [Thamnocephalis sphaerospora]|uniref:RRM domain-containing protein n=1 Tax=Thamnocephalis sphaerospora TaxID=78915 RepID=A0A4P9XVD1_9FUNG|nr:hypothetical protein THASP1DRAFT_28015 [Thamnocephalis sphaerospora]|eukprot:RKP10216.1 hypothetical protein THASP1DRAFT_28015 [Thamnocephalis sphaerospora]